MKAFFLILAAFFFLSCGSSRSIPHTESAKQNQHEFWQNLKNICGKFIAVETRSSPPRWYGRQHNTVWGFDYKYRPGWFTGFSCRPVHNPFIASSGNQCLVG